MVLQAPDARSGDGQDLDHSGRGHVGPSESVCATTTGDGERLVLVMHVAGRELCPDSSTDVESGQLDTLYSIPWARPCQDHSFISSSVSPCGPSSDDNITPQVATCGEETCLDIKVHLSEEGQTDVWALVGLRSQAILSWAL